MKGRGRLLIIFGIIISMVILFAQCMEPAKPPATEKTYAGAAACKSCHAAIVDSYLQNPHQRTSRPVEGDQLHDLSLPHSSDYILNPHLKISVEKRNGHLFQVAYMDGREVIARQFDIAIGSGEKAYTYGSWQGKELKQLPLSYFRAIDNWANSPGFPADKIYFDRPIGSQCLECHSSFVEAATVRTGPLKVKEELKKSSLVYGIDCERCHGPAGKHVEFHLDHPQEKGARYIAVYQSLTRPQKMDACAVCHGGTDTEVQRSTFAFKPGDNLRDYHTAPYGAVRNKRPDVHGNQSRLLARSKCFISSKTMDCSTCHRTHENLKGNLTAYSKRCMSCHTAGTIRHSPATLANAMVKTNCIDCHMPEQASSLISYQMAGKAKSSPYFLRTHQIAVY